MPAQQFLWLAASLHRIWQRLVAGSTSELKLCLFLSQRDAQLGVDSLCTAAPLGSSESTDHMDLSTLEVLESGFLELPESDAHRDTQRPIS